MCRKTTGACGQLCPTYVGEVGGGGQNFTKRFAQHLGTATQPCHEDTVKPVGRHFRLPGHEPHRDMVMLPIEKISDRSPFLRKARESLHIRRLLTLKRRTVFDIEHGLNLDRGQ